MACKVAWKNDTPVDPVDSAGGRFSFERFDNLEYRLILSNLERNAFHFHTLEEMLAYGRRWGGMLAHYGMSPGNTQEELFSQLPHRCNIAEELLGGGRWERTNRLQNNIAPFHTDSSFKFGFGQALANVNFKQLLKAVRNSERFSKLVVHAYKVRIKSQLFPPFQCRVGDASSLSVAAEDPVRLTLRALLDESNKKMHLRIVRQQNVLEPGTAPKRLFVEYKKATSEHWHKCAPLTPIVFEMGEKAFVFVQPNGVVPERFYSSSLSSK